MRKVIRFKNNLDEKVIDFIEKQSNFSETMTYLIEKELYENGNRDLVYHIPIVRNQEYFESLFNKQPIEVKTLDNEQDEQDKKENETFDKLKKLISRSYMDWKTGIDFVVYPYAF